MFNTDEFGWKDLSVAVNGRTMAALLGVKWSQKVERSLIWGKGNDPIGIQDGNVSYEGELKMHQSELTKLLNSTGNRGAKGLKGMTFNLAYQNDSKIETRTLVSCAISEIGEEYKQGDPFAEIALPFIFLGVK